MNSDGHAPDSQYWFVRLDEKLDDIIDTIGGHGQELTEHRVRIVRVEKDVETLHATNQEAERHRHEERRHRAIVRWGVFGAGFTGIAALVGSAIAVFGH